MTAPVTVHNANAAPDLSTQGASRKTYLDGPRDGMRVPMREVLLTTGDCVVLYDTSGPYTDAAARTDVRVGLAPVRDAWIAARGDTAEYDGRTWHPTDDGLRTGDLRNLDAVFPAGRRPRRAARGRLRNSPTRVVA